MTSLQTFSPNQPDQMLAAIKADGACIVHGLLEPSLCQALCADFQTDLGAMAWGADDLGYRQNFYGSQTKRLHGLFSRSSHMESVLTHPVLMDVSRELLVASKLASDVRLSNAELMVLGENQGVQVFHSDAASWPRAQQHERSEGHEVLISANYALTDFTVANGATRVVPGSHRWAAGREPLGSEICYAEMPQGSALLYSGNVLHSGGANTTDQVRIGLYLGYVVSWLRPLENHLVTNDPRDILALSERARTLLDVSADGFTVYA